MQDSKNKAIEDIYPLTALQQGILFHTLMAPDSGVYVQQFHCTIDAAINIAAFEQSMQILMDRHAALRSIYAWEKLKEPLQIVYRQQRLPIVHLDWRQYATAEQQDQLTQFLAQDRKQGFELTKPPLMRLTLIRLSDASYRFVWTYHHILFDGWSFALLMQEFLASYTALCNNRTPALAPSRSYRDYMAWLKRQDLAQAETFWRETLADMGAPTPLAINRSYPDRQGYAQRRWQSDIQRTQSLNALARDYGLTMNTLIQGVWAILLGRYNGQSDVSFGITVSGRPTEIHDAESIVGLLINSLPIRVHLPAEARLMAWLQALQAHNLQLRQFEFTPLTQIQAWSDIPAGTPLFESLVIFENYPVDASITQPAQALPIKDVQVDEQSNYPLTLLASTGKTLAVSISYDRHRFDEPTIERLLSHLVHLLDAIIAAPEARLGDLSLLGDDERRQLLLDWNQTAVPYPQTQTLCQLFEAQATRSPEQVALVFGETTLTYRALNAQSNQLAHHLRSLGVGPDTLVGICVERSLDMVVGLLAILKAGGAYVPLDPTYPAERLAYMLADAQPAVLLTQQHVRAQLPATGMTVFCLDAQAHALAGYGTDNLASTALPHHLAYVIYTSGSTGKPKGVAVTQGAMFNFMQAMQQA
ncbi:MAG TPA: condensation domain-containing protein, partial [Noviherbaspirillum sp.]|nr:condensation domain-containing protein [Noviherbaspirillum sp.]